MIVAYTGKTGSGKTYLMIKEAFAHWKNGRDIYSNTFLYFDKFARRKGKYGKIKYFDNMQEVLDIRDGIVLFDEAQVLFNARQWESLPEEFQYKLQQHRKHKIDLLCTTQNLGTIDITYRRLIHEWIHCKNMFQLGKSPRILIGAFKKQYKDIDSLYNNVDDLTVPNLKEKMFIIHYLSKKLYDTMYDIGFRRLKIVCLHEIKQFRKRKTYLIIPKKMSLSQAQTHIRLLRSHLNITK